MDVCVVMFDRKNNRIQQFVSSLDFKVEDVIRLMEKKKDELVETNPDVQIAQRFHKRMNVIECLPFTAYMSSRMKKKLNVDPNARAFGKQIIQKVPDVSSDEDEEDDEESAKLDKSD